jgi:MerR family transcriptional regulator, thiopeptide resistance regulator
MYTVKQVAALAGVTVRTLHHYDQIGLLKPSTVASNGYRYYDEAALFRLQQILLYREMDLELEAIRVILDEPGFDPVAALRSHREILLAKRSRLLTLIETVDETITHLTGGTPMPDHKIFKGLTPEQEKEMTREARLQYGPDKVNESVRRWASYTESEKNLILEEGNQIYADLAAALQAGKSAFDSDVQAIYDRWHQHTRYFYEPTLEILAGLGELYRSDPAFIANFQKLHPELPEYLASGIRQYVDDLETAAIEALLAADEDQQQSR